MAFFKFSAKDKKKPSCQLIYSEIVKRNKKIAFFCLEIRLQYILFVELNDGVYSFIGGIYYRKQQ
jgi:hypothetical protein